MQKNYYLVSKPAALLKVSGEDAHDYLQSQFSNDLRHKSVQSPVTYGLWLNQKGKVQADSFVLQINEETFFLLSYFCHSKELSAIIENNIIADEVEIEDLTDSATLVSFWGDKVASLLPPDGQFNMSNDATYCFRGRRSSVSGEVIVFHDNAKRNAVSAQIDKLFDSSWTEVTPDEAERERIDCGIPAIPQDIGPNELPQEAGLEKDAVSFTKGCYLGQEVMARLHAMGSTQRAFYRVKIPESLPHLPMSVFSGEKKAGELRSASGCTGLAILKKRLVEAGQPLHLAPIEGEIITAIDLLDA